MRQSHPEPREDLIDGSLRVCSEPQVLQSCLHADQVAGLDVVRRKPAPLEVRACSAGDSEGQAQLGGTQRLSSRGHTFQLCAGEGQVRAQLARQVCQEP